MSDDDTINVRYFNNVRAQVGDKAHDEERAKKLVEEFLER
ncbi:hypothetical protein SAMN04515695_2359 [Pseudovibrio sp. Tun.PSC04-5.I4]|nr:hypothetical protein SAMN04515695_2359 [Pseudovibrio sp. Tun.PSC04-5.I4]